ncbi:hypothetical protein [Gemmatimonas sp.]
MAAAKAVIASAIAAAVACTVVGSEVVGAQDSTTVSEPAAREAHHGERYALLAAGALTAATFNQATAMPSQWKRTWHGYGARVGDQVGFAATEELLRFGLSRAMSPTAPAMRCDGVRAGHPFWSRVGRAAACGVVNTLVVRTPSGARLPNVPLLGAIVGASAVSLAWRPERATAGKGTTFVLTRIAVVTGGTAANGAWREYRGR